MPGGESGSSRWSEVVAAQKRFPNAFTLCHVVAVRARQWKQARAAWSVPQAIDAALKEAAAGVLDPAPSEPAEKKRSARGPLKLAKPEEPSAVAEQGAS